MKKIITLVIGLVIALSTSVSAFATDTIITGRTNIIYKLTPTASYNHDVRFITFKQFSNIETLSDPKDYYELGGMQDYIALDGKTRIINKYGVDIKPIDLKSVVKIKDNSIKAGTYLIAELTPGVYKIKGDGIAVRLSAVPLDYTKAQIGEPVIVEGTAYIKVDKKDFALKLIGDVTATKVK